MLRAFVEKQGWDAVHWELVVRDVRIGSWIYNCLARLANRTLSPATAKSLRTIPGFRAWSTRRRVRRA